MKLSKEVRSMGMAPLEKFERKLVRRAEAKARGGIRGHDPVIATIAARAARSEVLYDLQEARADQQAQDSLNRLN